MARLSEALLGGAYEEGANRPMLDLQYGGQVGWSPNLAEFTSNQAYVSRPLMCIVLEVPKLFTVMKDAPKWIASFKAMMELHSKTIEGLNAGLKVDVDEHAFGQAGEMQQEFTNVTRERSQPKHGMTEKYGRPIQTLLDYWIRYGMMDPDTKFALAGIMTGDAVTDLLNDWYGATCLYIEPDPLHRRVQKAWITTGMWPTSGTGDIIGKKDASAGQEILNLDVEFAGVSVSGYGVNAMAQTFLDSIRNNGLNADPQMKQAFIKGVSSDIVDTSNGYGSWMAQVAKDAVSTMSK